MTISDTQFAAWLEDSTAQRVTLYEIGVNSGGVESIRKMSNRPYQDYLAVVSGGLKVTESISMDAQASMAAGTLDLDNADGSLDGWLGDVFTNRQAQAFVGDVRWDRTDFRMIFNGTVASDLDSKSRQLLNLKFRDKLQRLNTPVIDTKVGGSSPNPDTLVPVALGECHNITPVLTNPTTLEFAYSTGANEGLIEVRVDGRPRTDIVDSPTTGRFTFSNAVGTGQVTCSVQGAKYNGAYSNTISKLVQLLATSFGQASNRFTSSDLDATNLAAFDTAHAQPVNLYLSERTSVLAACQQLAASVGAQVISSRTGLLQLIQFAIPTSATTEIHPTQQLDRSISIVKRTDVSASVKLGYCQNYTPQQNLQTAIPDTHKALYALEWMSKTSVDSTVKQLYMLNEEPTQQNTCFCIGTDAQTEADRRRDVVKVTRTTYRFEGTPGNMLLVIGQAVTLFSNRFGLSAGKVGLVTGLSPDWGSFRVMVEVTV